VRVGSVAAGAKRVCTRGSNWALLGGPSTSPLDGMLHSPIFFWAYVIVGGFFISDGILAIRRGAVKFSLRSLDSRRYQRAEAPTNFWLVVTLDIGVGIALLLWAVFHAV